MGRYIVNVLLLLRMIKIYIVSKFKNSSTLFLLTDSPGTIETLCDFQRSSYALALFFKMASPQFSAILPFYVMFILWSEETPLIIFFV